MSILTFDNTLTRISFNPHATPKQKALVWGYMTPSHIPILGISEERCDQYFNEVSRKLATTQEGLTLDTTNLIAYEAIVNSLFSECDPALVRKLATTSVNKLFDSSLGRTTNMRQALLFMPPVYCIECDKDEEMFFFWEPYGCFRKEELKTWMLGSENLVDSYSPELEHCPACSPDNFRVILGSTCYKKYSTNAKQCCSCDACRSR